MPQFASTIKHIQEGVKGFTISAAVKNIEGWEETLKEMETPGAKGIVRDLERLKKLIQADPIDGESVKELCVKLGKATMTIADKAETKNAEKAKQLGEALSRAAA
ncbi:MAG: hypothetical protein V4653_14050 [Pseudomonadota bacterium]